MSFPNFFANGISQMIQISILIPYASASLFAPSPRPTLSLQLHLYSHLHDFTSPTPNPEPSNSRAQRTFSNFQVVPEDLRDALLNHPRRSDLLEIIMDLGRRPEARFAGQDAGEYLRATEVTPEDLAAASKAVGDFGADNRAGIEGTLHRSVFSHFLSSFLTIIPIFYNVLIYPHRLCCFALLCFRKILRISAIRNRRGDIVGLTCRIGRAVSGHIEMIRDLLDVPNSILFLGRPGVGKTTVIREIARVLADDFHKRVVIVDSSNEVRSRVHRNVTVISFGSGL